MQLAMIGLGRMGGNMARRPTYAALRPLIDNWRWQGVPFFLRSGKRVPRRVIEIAIRFRQPPHFYPAGKWGPAKADELIARDGASWRTP